MSFGLNTNESEQNNKSVNRFEFPYQLFSGLERTIGRPLSLTELLGGLKGGGRRGLFGASPQPKGQEMGLPPEPGGLGFPAPQAGGMPTPEGGMPTAKAEPKFTANDLIAIVTRIQPDKAADIGRLVTRGGLDPTGFTISDLQEAWGKFGKATGNSKEVFAAMMGALQDAANTQQSYETPRFTRGGLY